MVVASAAMAAASSNFSTGSTVVREGMPRVVAPPGWMLMVSEVPIMRLNCRRVSWRVASPTEAMAVSMATPTVTPSIMRAVRRRFRPRVRRAMPKVRVSFMAVSSGLRR
jgi:hypothetical protein